jgi:predicted GIY-YIG superfamily endonuclease
MSLKNILYVLKLQQNKYYVGITNDVNKRVFKHMAHDGSAWTSKYSYLSIDEVVDIDKNNDVHEETAKVCNLMLKYGHNNVRGAHFTRIKNYSIDEVKYCIGHTLRKDYVSVEKILESKEKLDIIKKERENKYR